MGLANPSGCVGAKLSTCSSQLTAFGGDVSACRLCVTNGHLDAAEADHIRQLHQQGVVQIEALLSAVSEALVEGGLKSSNV